jgi:integrase
VLESLQEGRAFSVHAGKIWAVPLSLRYGRQVHAEGRLLVLREKSVKRWLEFWKTPGRQEFLETYVQFASEPPTSKKNLLKALEEAAAKDPISVAQSKGIEPLSLAELVKKAQILAVLELPSVVVAHRSRQIVSHSLPPEALDRIGLFSQSPGKAGKVNLAPFPPPHCSSAIEEPGVNVEEHTGEEPGWMPGLRAALDEKALDFVRLNFLANHGHSTAKLLAKFALRLAKTPGKKGGRGSGQCSAPTVRRYCLLIATKVIPRLARKEEKGKPTVTEMTVDDWEEVLEQILEEDEFYRLKRYTDQPSSAAQLHSRALVKALRHWLNFLAGYLEEQSESVESPNRQLEMPLGQKKAKIPDLPDLRRLEDQLPVLGLIQVDASLITVDEYLEVLHRKVSGESKKLTSYEREADRVALILGYRCGLRRMETAGLQVRDIDAIDFLHVRPNPKRALKTSNARRDLPLRLLMPEDELESVRSRVRAVRELATIYADRNKPRNSREVFNPEEAYLFSEENNPYKMKGFETTIGRIHRAFRGDEGWQWAPIDPHFHYHRLRHTFSNFVLLKLWPGLGRMACHLMRGKKNVQTRQWIHSDSFRQKLLGTERLVEADLQALAVLLGHGSSATSLEHYLHVLDWYERPGTWAESGG